MSIASDQAEKEFISFFPGKRNHVFQFHDARQAMGAGKSQRIFTTSHPADFIVTSEGVTFYAEVKYSEDLVSFPFGNIKKSQWIGATCVSKAGGLYFFFIKSSATGRWYRVPAKVLLDVESRKSITWKDLEPYVYRTHHH